jgi:cytochrome bd-type quinol oxidase subunit 1
MDIFQDSVFLSRLQFSVTAMFHILWPLTSVGMPLVLVVFEALMGMTISYYPYRTPSSITIMETATSSKTLIFMFTGIGFLGKR